MLSKPAALAGAALLVFVASFMPLTAKAGTTDALADKQQRITWEQNVKRLVFDKPYKVPAECLSSFCTTDPAVYTFDITYQGGMTTPVLRKSSKDEIVDRQTLVIIKKLGPFPTLDAGNSNITPLHLVVELGFGHNVTKRMIGDEDMPTFDDLRSRQSLPSALVSTPRP
ncbi:MAG: hypothetical protein ACOH12_11365 [Parvibaculaceae bacterium]